MEKRLFVAIVTRSARSLSTWRRGQGEPQQTRCHYFRRDQRTGMPSGDYLQRGDLIVEAQSNGE